MKQVMRESLLIKLPVIIGDLFLLNLSWILALTLYPQPAYVARSLEIFACLNICFIPGLSWFGVILSSRIVPYEEIIRRVFYVVLCHLGFFVLIQTVWSYGLLPPVHLMGTFYIVLTVLLMLWRYTCRIVVKITRGHGRNARRVIIVGSKDNAQEVYHEMVDNTSTGYRVLGYFSNHDDHTLPDNTPCLGSVDEALPWLEAHTGKRSTAASRRSLRGRDIPDHGFLRKQFRPVLLRAQPAQLHETHDEPRTAGQRTDPCHPRGAVAAGRRTGSSNGHSTSASQGCSSARCSPSSIFSWP